METMTEVAPNQLPLFADMLTVEQEQRLTAAKVSATHQMLYAKDTVLRKTRMAMDTGFLGTQYIFSTECGKTTRRINVGTWGEEKIVEVELDTFKGDFSIIFEQYDESVKKIINRKASIELYGDKVECYYLNQSSRKIKPSTLLENVNKAATTAKYKSEITNLTKSTLDYTVDKYKTLYPNADVKTGKGYTSGRGNYTEFDTVTVKFKSGSYIEFRIGTQPNYEYVYEKYDAVTSVMKNLELMDHFNAQSEI